MPAQLETTTPPLWQACIHLMRLDRPVGILLLLWPTLWALWIAGDGTPKPSIVAIFIAGVVLMRSAGCVINDFADRKIDGHVERTQNRPLAQGAISPKAALILFASLCLSAGILVLFTNIETIGLAFIALMLATAYPFAKRWTHFPQLVLGAAFSMAIPMAFTALHKDIPWLAWQLFLLNLIWVAVYDTFYAMVDRPDDLKIGVKSTAVWLGHHDRKVTTVLQIIFLVGMTQVGLSLDISWPYFLAIGIAGLLCVWQQWLIRNRDGHLCFRAFTNNNWLGLVIFCGLLFGSFRTLS